MAVEREERRLDHPSPLGFRRELVAAGAYIAPGARIVGDVTIGEQSSVWFNAVLRGDAEAIRIGRRTNIQDNCVLHADPGFPCTLGDGVTVGHGAVVHGATVGDNVVVGMHAVVMNGAQVGENSIIAVGAVVTEGAAIPPGSLVMGMPGKIKRQLTAEEVERNCASAAHYVANAIRFAQTGDRQNRLDA
ncbi:MAG TPA: gamma carbonic anhydrase family protein [Pirellulales bacterium]|jgi:carbonic anhydrase/acetyltransferase-like protein (isoleucine patch superfamily)|nr:gamma carbonic anhydrase family protein [Pirellulales bacterium]